MDDRVVESVWFRCKFCKGYLESYKKMIQHVERSHKLKHTHSKSRMCPPLVHPSSGSPKESENAKTDILSAASGTPKRKFFIKSMSSRPTVTSNKSEKCKNKITCNECQSKFRDRHKLEIHLRIHSGERPFICKICSKSFAQLTNYNNHMRIHTGERPFKCKFCEKRFTQVTNQMYHERLHTGEKPFKCEICEKAFAQVANLRSHIKICTKFKSSL